MLVRDELFYQFGSIRLDPSRHTLERDGALVPLPARSLDALLLLVRKRGEVVSKAELLAHVWPDTHVEEASLPVMISAIRRAIGDDGRHQKFIQTVSKSGYRFIGEVETVGATGAVTPPAPPALPPPPAARFPRWLAVAALAAALAVAFLVYRSSYVRPVLARTAPASPTAEMWHQKGRYAWNLQTRDGILRSTEYYQKAIAEDASFAPAWAGLAISYVVLPSYSARPDADSLERARAASARAASLDDRLAASHIATGMVAMIADRNFPLAERELRRATSLDSSSALAEGELSLCLAAMGRAEDAVSHARAAKSLDPVSIRAATDLGIVLYYSHRFMEAESELDETLKLDPYSYRTHVNLGKTLLSLGRYDEARRVLEEASRLSNHDPIADGLTAGALALSGHRADAEAILAALAERARSSYVAPISLAFAHAALGHSDAALADLRRALDDHAIAALYLNVDPAWDSLRPLPAFRQLASVLK